MLQASVITEFSFEDDVLARLRLGDEKSFVLGLLVSGVSGEPTNPTGEALICTDSASDSMLP